MIKIVCFVALFALAFAAPRRDHEDQCDCEIHIMKDRRTPQTLLRFPIREFRNIHEKCDRSAVDDCVKVCKEEVGRFTHDLDLDHLVHIKGQPVNSFGQLLCDRIRHEFHYHQVDLEAHLTCEKDVNENGDMIKLDETVPTGMHSAYDFSCRRWKFEDHFGHWWIYVKGDRVEPTEAPPTTVPPTRPTQPVTTPAPRTTTAAPRPTTPAPTTSRPTTIPPTPTSYTTEVPETTTRPPQTTTDLPTTA